jgi:hypothetical protein
VICCCLSVVLYGVVFGVAVDRPLSLGILYTEMQQKSARLALLPDPKLVILAGSNGPFSHSCVVIGGMLGLPCENAGIAVGVGLDDLFARYGPMLRAGDVVYMPMETQQYVMTRAENNAGADGAMLFRYDRESLEKLPEGRILGAVFSFTLPDLVESLAEMPIRARGWISPDAMLATQYNAEGDRIDASLATADAQILPSAVRAEPDAAAIAHGYGTYLIARFVAALSARGVIVIGGLPTDFATVPLPGATIGAMRAVYVRNGGLFVSLPNQSRYPRADFYGSEDHLAQPCQYKHSIAIAGVLGEALHRSVRAPSAAVVGLAATCPRG